MPRAPSVLARAIGARLREAREKAGLSQTKLAAMVGSTQPAVARYEKGRMAPSVDACAALAQALEVRAGWLAFGEV